MWLPPFLAGWSVFTARSVDHLESHKLSTIRGRSPDSQVVATTLETSCNVAVLRRTGVRSASSLALESHIVSNSSSKLQSIAGGAGYAALVDIAGAQYLLSIDTGSSDTWLAADDVECISPQGRVPTSSCRFGPLFQGQLDGGIITDQNFNVSYGSGEYVTGVLGYANLTIADATINHQEIALVKEAYWLGDNETSGLMGFGYRSLTSSYAGDDGNQDNARVNFVGYSPIAESAMSQGLFSMFSLALQRGDNGDWGYLGLGGLPPVSINSTFGSTPILLSNLAQIGRSSSTYSFYAVQPDGFSISGGRANLLGSRFWRSFTKTTTPVIIDSGTTLNYLPLSVANRLYTLLDPPAVYNPYIGGWEVDCQAKTPDFAVRIGGIDLVMNREDLIIHTAGGYDSDTGLCLTTVQGATRGPYILGDAFLKNVIAVFDVGAAQMRFASRPYY